MHLRFYAINFVLWSVFAMISLSNKINIDSPLQILSGNPGMSRRQFYYILLPGGELTLFRAQYGEAWHLLKDTHPQIGGLI